MSYQAPHPSQTGRLLQHCPLSWRAYAQFGLAGLALLVLCIGFATISIFTLQAQENGAEKAFWVMLLLLVLSGFSGWTFWRLLRGLKRKLKYATLYEKGLLFGASQWMPLAQLAELQYNGHFPLLFGSGAEALYWRSETGEEALLYDEYLHQLPALKRQLAQLRKDDWAATSKMELPPVPRHLRPSEIAAYKHHPLTSVSIAGLLFLGGMFLHLANSVPFFWLMATAALWVASRITYYPALTSTHLLICHPLVKAWERAIPLSDIRELVCDERGRLPIRLIIITRDFERRSWYCASMWGSDWEDLVTAPALAKVIYRYQTDLGLMEHHDPTGT
jgi:hypothetical protein